MTRILLTGAGFSRNWGGWLADEVLEYLLGCEELGQYERRLLLADRKGGFEGALGSVQGALGAEEKTALNNFNTALSGMFDLMNGGFAPSAFSGHIQSFLSTFDAIFTLNQDLLLERAYNGPLLGGTMSGWGLPGLEDRDPGRFAFGEKPQEAWKVPGENFELSRNFQPYFKLHGSSRFAQRRGDGAPLLIMGANKPAALAAHPLLMWYSQCFDEYLQRPNARLMVVGYGFGDEHINAAIQRAAAGGTRVFLNHPKGIDVLRKDYATDRPMERPATMDLEPFIWGASRRNLVDVYREDGDAVELAKFSRFLARTRA